MVHPIDFAGSPLNVARGDANPQRGRPRRSSPKFATRTMASPATRGMGVMVGFAVLSATALAPHPGVAAPITADGYTFTNFDLPNSGTTQGSGTNINGISNNGSTVGFAIDNGGNFINYVRNADGTTTQLNLTDNAAMALGINNAGDVVGTENGSAVLMKFHPAARRGRWRVPAGATTAFGINDKGNIVGQYGANGSSPASSSPTAPAPASSPLTPLPRALTSSISRA